MRFLTEDAVLLCLHALGRVSNAPSQGLVTVNGRRVLVATDPESRTIRFCPNIGATIKPCQQTLPVFQGYSSTIRVDGSAVCLDTVRGLTDGTPPGAVEYQVQLPGQTVVSSDS